MGRNLIPSDSNSDENAFKDPKNIIANAKYWMNLGHAEMLNGDSRSLQLATTYYTKAINTLLPLPNDAERANMLGAALMNRGQLFHSLNRSFAVASSDFENACLILSMHLEGSNRWIQRNYIGALINHANLLLDFERTEEARTMAVQANRFAKSFQNSEPTDIQLSLMAKRVLCDAIGLSLPDLPVLQQAELATEASGYVETALSTIRSLRKEKSPEPFAEISLRLFHYGAYLYAEHRPQILERFISEHLATLKDPNLKSAMLESSSNAIRLAIDTLSRNAFQRTCESDEDLSRAKVQTESLHAFYQSLNQENDRSTEPN